jgi:hypothetical protein
LLLLLLVMLRQRRLRSRLRREELRVWREGPHGRPQVVAVLVALVLCHGDDIVEQPFLGDIAGGELNDRVADVGGGARREQLVHGSY